MNINQGVILVGGRGERLRPLTDKLPKPMVEVAGIPFLEHVVILLERNGIKRFLFLVGYLGDKIKSYFRDGSKWGVEIDYSFEEKPLGTGGALNLAKEKLDKTFFLLFGDSYLPIDYQRMASIFINNKKKVVLAVYDNAFDTDVPYNVMLDKRMKIIAAYNKEKNNPLAFNYCDAGVLVVSRNVVELIGEKTPISFEEAIYYRIIAEKELGYYIAECRFYDIGTIERLKTFEQYII
ncbi:MAG TPA: hypothetical protein ENL09_04080 [Bacteroidetes bacterium]|nr:hypothetical protein [Bacteroidota bacterium]